VPRSSRKIRTRQIGERPYTDNCPQPYKFEGKERDTESGNDAFGARYYSNRFGRWLSADWSAVPVAVPYANLSNPQTLNLYAMVADDPESFADLDGHQTADRLSQTAPPPTASSNCSGGGTSNCTDNQAPQQTGDAQAAQIPNASNILTSASYQGQSATVAWSQNTVVTTNADGSTTSTFTRTSAIFSSEPGQEGKYLGSQQYQSTETVSGDGKIVDKSSSVTQISQKDAVAAIGTKEFRVAQELSAEPDRAAYFARATMTDAGKNPAKYVAAAASVGAKVCPNPLCRAALGAVAAAAGAYQAYKNASVPNNQ
jgi:RHS repeat-associated protein